MLQQVMTEPGKIIFREIPVPEIGDGQVLVKIMDIGVCGHPRVPRQASVHEIPRDAGT